eukprot:TRINITY_DN14702_c0_g1_i3.p2 TRINITY_DN14702_c0_g1~~TRINITY_DN14702_c0_g1_i3.p2  ORF type:complete len:296 (-),score=95.73 TRINITY_DN14702_c0_g1_i3:80-967(-)
MLAPHERQAEKSGPPKPSGWRPSGVARRPPTPTPRTKEGEGARRFALGDAPQAPGSHSEARLERRREVTKDMAEKGLFGAQGLLAQLRDGEAREERVTREIQRRQLRGESTDDVAMMPTAPARPTGPPMNGIRREQERKALKEAKVQMMLEERAARLSMAQQEAEEKRAQARQAAMAAMHVHSASAPDLQQFLDADDGDAGSIQKKRIACKMEVLDFFKAYSSGRKKASADETAALLTKLHKSMFGEADASSLAEDALGADPAAFAALDGAAPAGSVQQRLQQVTSMADMAFAEL